MAPYERAGLVNRIRNPIRVHSVQVEGRGEREIHMTLKKKKKRFQAVTAVKELARERVGSPPAGQIVIEKKKKPEKHKPTLDKLLED